MPLVNPMMGLNGPDGDQDDMMARKMPGQGGAAAGLMGAKPHSLSNIPLPDMSQPLQQSQAPMQLPNGGMQDPMSGLPQNKSMGQMGIQANPQAQGPGFWQKFGGGLGQLLSGGVQGAMQGWKGTQPGMQAPPPPGQPSGWQRMLGSGLGGM